MEKEIKRRIVDFIGDAINYEEGQSFLYAMYGFYVSKFNKVCYLLKLPSKLADELIEADKDVKKEFLELVEEMNPTTYDDMGIRVCDTCGKFMTEGYYLAGEYACSEECAVKNYMEDGLDESTAKDMFQHDLDEDEETCAGEVYWTEW